MQSITKLFVAIAMTTSALSTYPAAAYAKDTKKIDQVLQDFEQNFESKIRGLETLEKRVEFLETNEIMYGPLAVSHVRLGHKKQFASIQPGRTISCSFHYKLDSSQQEFLSKHHLIVGLKDVAAETCATHLYGVWDSVGKAEFDLIAPLQEGDYEVRIAYRPGNTCEEALNSWNVLGDEPSSFATIGILRVRN